MIYCCKDCTKRCVGCHSVCEDYIAQKAKHDKLREQYHQDERTISLNSNGTYYKGNKKSSRTKRR